MIALLRLVPTSVWVGIAAAIAVMAALWAVDRNGYSRGAAEVRAQWEMERAEQIARIAELEKRNAQVVVKEVIKYRDRVKVVREKAEEVIREIPVLVPVDIPALPGAVRVLHDAAAGGELPDDPAGAARAAEAVEVPALVETVADNYAACRADAERLVALQNIVKGSMP